MYLLPFFSFKVEANTPGPTKVHTPCTFFCGHNSLTICNMSIQPLKAILDFISDLIIQLLIDSSYLQLAILHQSVPLSSCGCLSPLPIIIILNTRWSVQCATISMTRRRRAHAILTADILFVRSASGLCMRGRSFWTAPPADINMILRSNPTCLPKILLSCSSPARRRKYAKTTSSAQTMTNLINSSARLTTNTYAWSALPSIPGIASSNRTKTSSQPRRSSPRRSHGWIKTGRL